MKTLVLLLLFASALRMSPQGASASQSTHIAEGKCQSMNASLEVSLQRVEGESAGQAFKIVVRNVSGEDVYVVTDPKRTDGSSGPYWYPDPKNERVLIAGFALYEPSRDIFFDHDDASARLTLLHPSESYSAQITATLPIRETVPPYRVHNVPRVFVASQISGMKAEVGYFPSSDELRKLVASKPHGTMTGADFVAYGNSSRSIASFQCIASSPVLAFAPAATTLLHESGHAAPTKPQ
ncbi:hypothetical protein BDD14_4609 [Edaphobacter modestus]|uniref:Uncharacterized protein n=2 Tax=Edaphobacter modestus TaxID=388466 RepID=A0A4Q7YZ04_9BACT|nr:hypothetical protein BDD14_4609 [Edaphobacter modestus]